MLVTGGSLLAPEDDRSAEEGFLTAAGFDATEGRDFAELWGAGLVATCGEEACGALRFTAGQAIAVLHFGQRTFFPAALSGTLSVAEQPGHFI